MADVRERPRTALVTGASGHVGVNLVRLNHPVVDHAKATRELGYLPRPLVDTVRDLVTWLGQDGQLDPRRQVRATVRRARRGPRPGPLAAPGRERGTTR